jgi:peroxiredoxin
VPTILENYQAYHDRGFEVLGISLDTDRGAVERYLDEVGVPWPTLFSDNAEATGWEHPMAAKYAITSIPRAILVDRAGRVLHLNARGQTLGAELKRLLGEPSTGQLSAREVSSGVGAVKQQTVSGTR